MYFVGLFLVGLAGSADSLVLECDVYEIQTLEFGLPLRVAPDRKEQIDLMRLYVSEDRGKTWKHASNHTTKQDQAIYSAPHDGHYWFTLQIVYKDGTKYPTDVDQEAAAMKVYVNSKRKTLRAQKSCEELRREVEDLRKTVEELKQKVAKVESASKGK